jgi:ribosomal-protein-alanine acetyltransferase
LGDLDALARLEAVSFPTDKLSRRSFMRFVRSPTADLLVAARSDRVLGYALVLCRRSGRSARLYSIAVAAEEAGRGVGSRLLAAAEARAKARGAERLTLEVRSDNPAAINFYRRRGYQEIGTRKDYYEDGMSARLFSCALPEATAHARDLRHAA